MDSSFSELREKQQATKCRECDHDAVARHTAGWFCARHWLEQQDDWKLQEARKQAAKLGIKKGMGREECLPILREAMSRFRAKSVSSGNP